jgi:predicted RNA-binding Zn-ribbon protein involved in translation (DUF1610 family)
MPDDDFFEFMVFYELLFPDDQDKECECSECGRVIKGSEKVEWLDKKRSIFKCPNCGEEVEVE